MACLPEPDNPALKIHHGSLRGCWPTVSAVEDET